MQNKKGISLIVLVITVIVMIILAGSVIISLSNSGIIGKANEAVDANNLKQVQQLAALAWSEAYIDKMEDDTVDIEERVEEALEKNKVDQAKYAITVTESGVVVKAKTTLGALVKSADDYGKKVDYTVTVDGTEHKDWRVLYEDEANGYVYIITTNSVEKIFLYGIKVASLSAAEKELYEKFRVGSWQKYTLIDTYNGNNSMFNSQAVALLIRNYGNFANKTLYGETNVIGAIGSPTIELIAAGWNEKGYEPKMTLGIEDLGYNINGSSSLNTGISDGLYIPSDDSFCLASPAYPMSSLIMSVRDKQVGTCNYSDKSGIRPVVCLSSNIPAVEGDNGGFSLLKNK